MRLGYTRSSKRVQFMPEFAITLPAVGLDPASAPARSTLGLLLLLNKDPVHAGRQFEEALSLNPSLAEAHIGRGQVLVTRGRFQLPALNAFCMYDPQIASVSGWGTVEVHK